MLKDIKITHCPACNQEVTANDNTDNHCFLCHKPIVINLGTDRIEFEVKQLQSEKDELDEIILQYEGNINDISKSINRIKEEISSIENSLIPIKKTVTDFLDPKVSIIDYNRGKLQEQIENYKKLLSLFNYREELTENITNLDKDIANLEHSVDSLAYDINYERIITDVEDGMMNYLNILNSNNMNRWEMGRIKFFIDEKRYNFKVENEKWSTKLGGTLTCIFLMAYHYSLMCLSSKDNYRYPGLLIVDFPPVLADGFTITDKENYLVEPFFDLCHSAEKPIQVIIAGRAFENIRADNKIALSQIYKPTNNYS